MLLEPRTRPRAPRLLARRNREGDARFGGTSCQLRAPIERLWRIVSDPAMYPGLIPLLERVRVMVTHGTSRVLRMDHRDTVASTNGASMRPGPDRGSSSRTHADAIVAWGMPAGVGPPIQRVFGPFLNPPAGTGAPPSC